MSYDGCPSVRIKETAPQELKDLFPDNNCILVGGAMTTPALWDAFALNPCHYCNDGTIMAWGRVIAHHDDVEVEELPEELP